MWPGALHSHSFCVPQARASPRGRHGRETLLPRGTADLESVSSRVPRGHGLREPGRALSLAMALGTPSPALSQEKAQGEALVCIRVYTRVCSCAYLWCVHRMCASNPGWGGPVSAGITDMDVSSWSPVWKGAAGPPGGHSSMERTQGPGADFFFFLWISVSFNSACLTSK